MGNKIIDESIKAEFQEIWDECKRKCDEVNKKYEGQPGIDKGSKEIHQFILEADEKARKLRREYGIEIDSDNGK